MAADRITVAMLGHGEAGRAFAAGWEGAGVPVTLRAFDIRPERSLQPDRRSALAGADAVFCLVTADRAHAALEQAAPFLPEGVPVFDGNSCAPATKRKNARLVEAVGARYVDMAIMAPVHPRLHETPVLLAGPHAQAAADLAARLGMRAEVVGDEVGQAAAVKMIRSVMVKGLEALTAECVLAAEKAGVAGRVLDSLEASYPGFGFADRAAYNLERMMVHGTRRAAEMREVAASLRALGLGDRMAAATAAWQERIGALGLAPGPDDWQERARRVLAALGRGEADRGR